MSTKRNRPKSHYSNLERWMNQAAEAWGADTNVKAIGFAKIEGLISVSQKSMAYLSRLLVMHPYLLFAIML